MGIKAHYLQDKNHERFYPYAHAVATFDRDGVTVQKRLDDIDTTIDNINTNIEGLDVQSDWDEDDTSNKAYIKNKPTSMPASDVPAWAKEPTKPSYTWSEINSKPGTFPPSAHDHENATSSTDGFLSYIDKNKLDSIEEGATKTIVDSALSSTSTNPVQNKVVNSALAGKVPTSRTINGKALTANITLSASDVNAIPTSQKGSANGVATLDQNGFIPTSQLPASVDEIIEGYLSGGKFYKESEHLNEITGEASKIYVDITAGQNLTYRWSGTAYVEISKSLALGETSGTAYRGDRGKIAYDHSQSTHARTDATKTEDSSTNGNIKINGSEVNVYTHPSYTSKSSGLYKITVDSTGHVSGTTAVSKSDITALGIPGQDTNTTYNNATSSTDGLMSSEDKVKLDGIASGANKYVHPSYTAKTSGLYKVTVDSTGHVSAATAVTKSDITALGIPAQDTNTTYSAFKGATASAAGGTGLVPAPATGYQARFLRGDGTWATPANTTYAVMTGATTEAAGKSGLVPAPSAGSATRYLRSDGTWVVPPNTTYSTATTSTAGLMSSADKTKLDGIASGANKYTHPSYTAKSSGLYKVTIDSTGHVSATAAVTKSDITALGIPGTDTNTTYSVMKGATSSAAGTSGLVPAPATGKQTSFLRGDGTWVIPTDTKYTHPTYTSRSSGLYKITVDGTGHVSGATAVTKADITGLGIPGTDTNTWTAFKGATSSAAGTAGYVPAPSAGSANRYFRSDGTWAVPPDTNTNTTYTLSKSGSTITLTGSDGRKTSVTDSNTTYSLGSFGITATAAELNYCDGVTSNIQTQLNGKAASSHTHNYAGSSSAGGSANRVKGTLTIQTNGSTKASFNGSASATVNITASSIGAAASSHSHSYLPLGGGTMTGNITFNTTANNGSWIQGKTRALIMISPASPTDGSAYHPIMMGKTTAGDVWNLGHGASDEVGFFGYYKERTENGTDWAHYIKVSDGTVHFGKTVYGTFSGSLSGNASTATTATTATTANKTAGTLTVQFNGSTNKTFNGSSSQTVNITPSAIGAAASSHSHNYAGSSSAGGAANSVKGALTISLNGTSQGAYNGSAAKSINITASSVGAAASSHNHSAANITSGTLAVSRGGTGITSNPSLLVNLGSTSAASVFATSPRPGITGTLAVSHGGTGSTSAAGARNSLGATQVKGQSSEPSQNTGDVWLRWV